MQFSSILKDFLPPELVLKTVLLVLSVDWMIYFGRYSYMHYTIFQKNLGK